MKNDSIATSIQLKLMAPADLCRGGIGVGRRGVWEYHNLVAGGAISGPEAARYWPDISIDGTRSSGRTSEIRIESSVQSFTFTFFPL